MRHPAVTQEDQKAQILTADFYGMEISIPEKKKKRKKK